MIDGDPQNIVKQFTIIRSELDHCLAKAYSPAKLIQALDDQFQHLYQKDAGNWEGYTLGEHTTMVLRQFDRYYSHRPLPGAVEIQLFRLFLALHDIGKPIAITIDPLGKSRQHHYTWQLMNGFYEYANVDRRFIDISKMLLHGDLLGAYLRNRRPQTKTERLIRKQAMGTTLTTEEYFELLQIYYKVDAGSYTEDAGGKRSLDTLFEFDHKTPELRFAQAIQQQIDRLSL